MPKLRKREQKKTKRIGLLTPNWRFVHHTRIKRPPWRFKHHSKSHHLIVIPPHMHLLNDTSSTHVLPEWHKLYPHTDYTFNYICIYLIVKLPLIQIDNNKKNQDEKMQKALMPFNDFNVPTHNLNKSRAIKKFILFKNTFLF